MNKILVLGTGIIGSQVIEAACQMHYDIATVDISKPATYNISLSDSESLEDILEHFKPNVVFNTAGIDHKSSDNTDPLHLMSDTEWQNIFTTNTNITINVARQVLSYFMNTELSYKRLIYTPSTYSFESPNPEFYDNDFIKSFAYVGSKTIEVDIVKYIARHYAKHNIICNGLVPHVVMNDVKILDTVFCPMGRSCEPSELIPAIKMLIDPGNSFMNGEFIKVNGGWTA